jgi:hypothetical protein
MKGFIGYVNKSTTSDFPVRISLLFQQVQSGVAGHLKTEKNKFYGV